MGRYVDWDFVANQFPLVSRGPSADEVNSFYIIHAEAEIDGRLAGYFTVPFSSNNLTVQQLAGTLTYLKMGLLRDEKFDRLQERFDKRMMDLVNGDELMIVVTDSGTVETLSPSDSFRGAISSTTEDYHPTFGMGDFLDFAVDSSRLIDEENERE